MDALINIIHPYTFKLDPKSKSFVIGPMNEYRGRDHELSRFVKRALDLGARVLHHRSERKDSIKGIIHDVAFSEDPFLSFLLDARIDMVVTTVYGMPIRNERPPECPPKEWDLARYEFSSDAEMAQKVGRPNLPIFLGGIFENCIANAVHYHQVHYGQHGGSVRYVPALCVSFDKGKREAVEQRFEKQGVLPITTAQALSLMGNGHANL